MSAPESLVTPALQLAARGLPVFPCRPTDKKPFTVHGFKDASRDPSTIREWWRRWPKAIVGMPTGAVTKLVVLDVDVDREQGKDGEAALRDLLVKHGAKLPETRASRTPRGGRHLYFQHPGVKIPSRTDWPAPDIDVRGDGGYVIVPPSQTDKGRYKWISMVSPLPLPDWLLRLLKQPEKSNRPAPPHNSDDCERARGALRFVPAADRTLWRDVGFALKSHFGEAGWTLFDEWSRTAPEHYSEQENRKQWDSFKAGGGITIATLFHRAKENGWQAEQRPRYRPGSLAAELFGPDSEVKQPIIEPPRKYSPPPLTLLPRVLREYVLAEAKALDVDVAFIFVPLLSALAAAIGNSRNIRIKKGFVQPAILWTALVARSGSKKSPAFSAAIKFLVNREQEFVRLNTAANKIFEKEHREWDAKSKKERGDEPQQPARLTCLVDNLTLAVVAPILRDNPRGALNAKDELASWFGSFGQFSKTPGGAAADVSDWLQLFNGERLLLDRKTNRESHRIFNPRLSIAGCIPPDVLRGALTKDFFWRGLPARILFAAPPPRPNVWTDAEVPADLEAAATGAFNHLFAIEADEGEYGPVPRGISIAPAGMEVFTAFYNRVGHHAIELGENEEAAWHKLTGGAARFALVGHLVRGLDGRPVGADVMQAAVDLSSWFGHEAERIYAQFHESPDAALTRRLVEFIERRGGEVTLKEVGDNFRPLKNETEQIERRLNQLVASHCGEWRASEPGQKGGRPTRRFQLFPGSRDPSATAKPRNPEQNTGFADADTLDTPPEKPAPPTPEVLAPVHSPAPKPSDMAPSEVAMIDKSDLM